MWLLKYLLLVDNKQWILISVKKVCNKLVLGKLAANQQKSIFFHERFVIVAVVAFAACFRNYNRAESQPQANLHSNKKLATSQKSTRKTSNPQTSHKLKTQGVNKPATRQARMSSQACGIWLVGDHFKVCGPLVWQLGVTLHCTIANKIKFAEIHWNKPRTNELRSSGMPDFGMSEIGGRGRKERMLHTQSMVPDKWYQTARHIFFIKEFYGPKCVASLFDQRTEGKPCFFL